jgi:glucokinase
MILVGDIGGTHSRLALAERHTEGWRLTQLQVRPTTPAIGGLIRDYLSALGAPALELAAFGGAGPLAADGSIQLTNSDCVLEPAALAQAAGVARALVVNDFAAIAQAIPILGRDELRPCGGGNAQPRAPRLVIGAGTGLGVAGLVRAGGGWQVLAGEGGHADLAAADAEQAGVLAKLHARFGRVCAETVLSGPGLVRLYAVRAPDRSLSASAVAEAAWRGEQEALHTVRLFARWLGGFAGNLALTLGAQGGVYIAGGIVPAWGERFPQAEFRAGFEDKPPYADWLRAIPSYVVTHPQPGLLGLAELAGARSAGRRTTSPA